MTTAAATGLREYLAILFAGATGVMELRALPSGRRSFVGLNAVRDVERFIAQYASDDLYVGVAARKDSTSGKLENCSTLGVLATDIDFKQTPEAEARETLRAFPLPPTVVVHSGGGLHVYFGLREPLDLSTDAARARDLLVRLAVVLGGDRSAAEPARVLRLPGTWNHKPEYGAPRPVTLEVSEPDHRYNPSELEEWLPPPQSDANGAARFHAPDDPVTPGGRSLYLFRLARSLKLRGLSEAAVLAAARAENAARCRPPLPDEKVVDQARSAFEQADRPGFEPRPIVTAEAPPPNAQAKRSPTAAEPEWPVLAPEALHGLAGRVVQAIEPYSEADRMAVLLHTLVGVGNLIGAGPHAMVERTAHPARLSAACVGRTAKGRKGQSWSTPRYLLSQVDDAWASHRVRSGLVSGEGLIFHVRDERWERQPIRERGRVLDYQEVLADAGEPDKRLFVIEPEFGRMLRTMTRDSNTLSAVLRDAWDRGDLSTLAKNAPLRATGAHVSLIGHITQDELVADLTATDQADGFANRILWALVRRSKALPFSEGPPEAALAPLVDALRAVVRTAQTMGRVTFDDEAAAMWSAVYPELSEPAPGLLGHVLARAEAQVLRLSVLYAVLDQTERVSPPHLEAALAVWEYCATSARVIFGDRLGDPIADRILLAVRQAGEAGLTQDHLVNLFARHQPKGAIDAALARLQTAGRIRPGRRETGRPGEEGTRALPPPAIREESGAGGHSDQ